MSTARVLVLALLSVTASLAAFAPAVAADESIGKDWRILFDDAVMEEPTTDAVYNLQPGGAPYFLGTNDQILRIVLCNGHATNAATNVRMTVATADPVITGLRGATANAPTATVATIGANACSPNTAAGFQFRVNLSNSGGIGKHALWLNLSWDRSGSSDSLDNVPFEIHVSSIFDPVTGDPDVHDLPRLLETTAGGNGFFLGNQTFQPASIALVNGLGATIRDLEVTLGTFSASGVAPSGGRATAKIPTVPAGALAAPPTWRVDFNGMPNPGVYTAGLEFKYVRDDGTPTQRTITERGAVTRLTVAFTAAVTAELVAPATLVQGNVASFQVRFRNAGNTPLLGLTVEPAADGPTGDFFFNPALRYENDDAVGPGRVTVGDLAVGASSAPLTISTSHLITLPEGTHRLAFRWNAWMHDDGAAGVNPGSAWMRIGGFMADDDGNARTPEVGQLYRDANENGVFDGGDGAVVASPWPGAFVEFLVTDGNGPLLTGTVAAPLSAAKTTNVALTVTLANQERYGLLDVVPTLRSGAGTPFRAAGDAATNRTASTSSPFTLGAAGGGTSTRTVTFMVDVDSAWWTAASRAPGVHQATLLVNATATDSGRRWIDLRVPVTVEILGFGPNLLPTAVTNGPVVPGQTFRLNVTIRNTGDDVARNVEVALAAPGKVVNILQDFFDPRRNASLAMRDFGASSWNDMVSAEIVAERALSSPMAKVARVHVDRIGPGETALVSFEMVADPNLVPGVTYTELLTMTYTGSQVAGPITKGPLPLVLHVAGAKGTVVGEQTGGGGFFQSPGPGAFAGFVAAAASALAIRRRLA